MILIVLHAIRSFFPTFGNFTTQHKYARYGFKLMILLKKKCIVMKMIFQIDFQSQGSLCQGLILQWISCIWISERKNWQIRKYFLSKLGLFVSFGYVASVLLITKGVDSTKLTIPYPKFLHRTQIMLEQFHFQPLRFYRNSTCRFFWKCSWSRYFFPCQEREREREREREILWWWWWRFV